MVYKALRVERGGPPSSMMRRIMRQTSTTKAKTRLVGTWTRAWMRMWTRMTRLHATKTMTCQMYPARARKKNKDKVYTEAHRSLGMVVAKVRHRYYIVQGLDGGWHRLDRKEVSRDQPLYVGQLLTFRYRCHSHRRTAVQAAALDWHSAARVQWAEFMGIPSCLLKVEVDGDVTVLHDGDECKLGADAPSHMGDFFKAGRQIHMPMFIADDF